MNNGEWFAEEKEGWGAEEVGSDELLADEQLRLPESASILVRLHAVRSWLEHRRQETIIEEGEVALALQEALATPTVPAAQEQVFRPRRRREQAAQEEQLQRATQIQQSMLVAQQRRSAYEEAQTLLEECVTHASGERVLVEYYLALEDLVQAHPQEVALLYTHEDLVQAHLQAQQEAFPARSLEQPINTPWLQAMADVQHRVEQVGIRENEED